MCDGKQTENIRNAVEKTLEGYGLRLGTLLTTVCTIGISKREILAAVNLEAGNVIRAISLIALRDFINS